MPKYNKEIKTPNKPYSRSKLQEGKSKSKVANENLKKKSITKSERVKNANMTNQLDNLMDDLSNHLTQSKKPKKTNKDKVLEQQKLDEQQRQYEQMQNDMDDALGLLTSL
ncbi:hypothetical protein BCR42DRAFT_427514 [Absidia repens]|uniref:Uncharacterized protein n=1 Tax=Absidia repens TaxID=90262 RepID=A0A1X2HZJ7_9FUNG|nr:hypothetical protein BCR42DRAFT_427514 [Absidia repens]